MAKSMMSRMPRFSAKSPMSLSLGMGPMFNVILIAFLFVLAFLIYQLIVGGKGGEGFREGTTGSCSPSCTGSQTCKKNRNGLYSCQ
jgi:hypothetical protein